MMNMRYSCLHFVASLALLGLFMPAVANSAEFNDLVGRWFGEEDHDSTIKTKWLTIRDLDGNLAVKVRYYKDGKFVSEAMSTGRWELLGDKYVTIYTATNARVESPPQVHQYELLGFDGEMLTYRSIQRDQFFGSTYRVRRVQSDFSLP